MSLFSSDGQTLFVGRPSAVMASMSRDASQSLASGAISTVQVDTVRATSGHSTAAPATSTSSYSITPQVSGYYRIAAFGTFQIGAAPTAGSYCTIGIAIAGTAIGQSIVPAVASSFAGPCCSVTEYVAAGQAITMQAYQNTGAAIATLTDAVNKMRFYVEMVG